MSRAEFSKATKRAALKRSGKLCEASGAMYGFAGPNHRCRTDLSYGVEYDHIILEANSHDNSLANCAAVCIPCHRFKTPKDTKIAAKTLRQQDKNNGIKGRKFKWPKRPFNGWAA